MRRRSSICLWMAGLSAVFLSLVGCAPKPPETVDELVSRLKQEGVEFTSTELVDMTRFGADEGTRLRGDQVDVEIFHFSDADSLDRAKRIARPLGRISGLFSSGGIPKILFQDPFILVVRREATEGQIESALKNIFPEPES